MYNVSVTVNGTAPLMQHRFPMPDLVDQSKGGHKSTGAKDYTDEWRDYLYVDSDGQIFQPAVHFEGALFKAAAAFKITGKRGATYKELFKANVFITPDQIPHVGFTKPDALDYDADKPLYLDARPVVIQRNRVVRIRPVFAPGWKLDFEAEVLDDEIQSSLLQDVLAHAGKAVGIGEYRPRFGRFNVTKFEVHK
jgi:hypothetical protein